MVIFQYFSKSNDDRYGHRRLIMAKQDYIVLYDYMLHWLHYIYSTVVAGLLVNMSSNRSYNSGIHHNKMHSLAQIVSSPYALQCRSVAWNIIYITWSTPAETTFYCLWRRPLSTYCHAMHNPNLVIRVHWRFLTCWRERLYALLWFSVVTACINRNKLCVYFVFLLRVREVLYNTCSKLWNAKPPNIDTWRRTYHSWMHTFFM